ncbi:hypothetical protein MLPF_3150 [Mycobacterium lepromatosis]|nr:hypothetical protein MLPF_3150 [Mycobacterium lepromatosis]
MKLLTCCCESARNTLVRLLAGRLMHVAHESHIGDRWGQ